MNSTELNLYAKQIKRDLNQINGQKVMIIGDLGVDEYIWGDVKRISPEAPVPVVDVNKQDARLGLSANVAANVVSLGGEALLVGVVGNDSGLETLSGLLKKNNVSTEYLINDSERPTTRKIRIMAAEHQQIVRVDFEKKKFLSDKTAQQLLSTVRENIAQTEVVLLQDYAKGVLSESLCQEIIALCKAQGKKVLVDPHRNTPLSYYKGADLFKPNSDESIILSGLHFDELRQPEDMMHRVAEALKSKLSGGDIVITMGKRGVLIYSNGEFSNLPTFARDVFDVTGAGDTVIASLALATAVQWPLVQACAFANFTAGIVVSKVGCVPCGRKELEAFLEPFTKEN